MYLHYFLKGNNIQHMFFDGFYQTDLGHHHNYEMRYVLTEWKKKVISNFKLQKTFIKVFHLKIL